MSTHDSIVGVIGGTPSIWLDRLVAQHELEGRILAKLEYLNPGFSKKDRAALAIIEMAEASGELRPGQTVVELTSGNMGTGLAIVCGSKGYPFVAVMSRGNSPERARMMTALGAEVILVDQAPGAKIGEVSGTDLALVDRMAHKIATDRGAFRADQFNHPGNVAAHECGTGPELWADSGHSLSAFVDFAGSGGTFVGVRAALQRVNLDIRAYLVESKGAQTLAGEDSSAPNHPIQGGGYAMTRLPILSDTAAPDFLTVSAEDARETARNLARSEGIFGGYSAGANVAAALSLLAGPEKGGVIGVIICDSGLKYLSTDLFD